MSSLFTQSGLFTQGLNLATQADLPITQTLQTQTLGAHGFASDPWASTSRVQEPHAPAEHADLSKLDLNGLDDGTTAEPAQLPEYACAYCGIHNPACVVKCMATGKWFCNQRSTKSGSCIVVHLVKSKNKEVQLHKDSPLGDAVLECYATGTRNIFLLGFVPVKGENTVVLLARDTPGNHPAVKDLDLDMSQWQPIVEERCLVSWLVKVPTERERRAARHITKDDVMKLEAAWKVKPTAQLDDLEPGSVDEDDGIELTPVALRYTDVAQYLSVFRPLVKTEADHDKTMREGQSRDDITVRWDWGLNHKRLAFFYFLRDDGDIKLLPGDELKLRHPGQAGKGPWEGNGIVLKANQTEEVCLEMNKTDVPEDMTTGFHVDFVWKSTSFDRMRSALAQLDKDKTAISQHLLHTLLGHDPEPVQLRVHPPKKGMDVPTLPPLNHSQLAAVKAVLTSPISLVQGPPGTGKTVTSAAVVYHIVQACKKPDEPCVLVAAPSNVAVDQLASKVSETGLKVVRLTAKAREDVASPCEHLTLHYQVRHVDLPGADLFRKLLQLREDQGGLRVEDEKQLMNLRRKLEAKILEAADVICCTCVGAGDPRLKGFKFQHILMDEATQSTEPECLIPMVNGAKQVVLVGDHCQLGPVIMCKKAGEAGLSQSLFERLRLLGVKPIRLQVQYRMHPCLSEFPSNTFYEGSLQNGIGVGDRLLKGVDFPWPVPDKPMMFYCQLGSEELSGSGTSFLNRTEASNVEKVVTRLLQNGVSPSQIGIITPYEGQRAHIVSVMTRQGALRQDLYTDIEVSSVDAFQGREKDVIVMSCVRSNEQQELGFLTDPRRLNVALTRAKRGLVILGNPKVLSKSKLWRSLLQHFKEAGVLVEGPLTNLKPSMIQIGQVKKDFDRSTFGIGALTTNRYVPPERVGEAPLDKKDSSTVTATPAGPGNAPVTGSGRSGAGAAQSEQQSGRRGGQQDSSRQRQQPSGTNPNAAVFMPFTMPSYVISQMDNTQADGLSLDASKLFTQADGVASSKATQAAGAGLQPFTQGAGGVGSGLTFKTQLPGLTNIELPSQLYGETQAGVSAWPGTTGTDLGLGALPAQDLQDNMYDSLLLTEYAGGADGFVDPVTGLPM